MPTRLKICGLRTEEALDAALAGGADFVGLVHFPRSPRHVDASRAGALAARARDRAGIVLLTVDAAESALDELVDAVRPDILQLHGRESPDAVSRLKARFRRPVWKALPVAEAADLDAVAAFAGAADRVLFDAKPPRDAALPGGNGRSFDWALLSGVDPALGYVLSGGLDPERVGAAVARLRPWAVDVSSGVERAPGEKDPARIAAFIAAARAADHAPA